MASMLLFFFSLNKSLKLQSRPIDKNGSLVPRLDGTTAATSAYSATSAATVDANDLDGPELSKHLQRNATR